MTTNTAPAPRTETNCKGITMTVGKTYAVQHCRKGKWRAQLVEFMGDPGDKDLWIKLDDDITSPVRFDFIDRATEVSAI